MFAKLRLYENHMVLGQGCWVGNHFLTFFVIERSIFVTAKNHFFYRLDILQALCQLPGFDFHWSTAVLPLHTDLLCFGWIVMAQVTILKCVLFFDKLRLTHRSTHVSIYLMYLIDVLLCDDRLCAPFKKSF